MLKYRNLTNRDLIVVYDELDLPWTALRIKKNGSAAGHNGVKSIIAALKTDVFTRVRVGIRPDHPIEDAAEYVLAPFEREMKDDVERWCPIPRMPSNPSLPKAPIRPWRNSIAAPEAYKKRKNENLRRVVHRSSGCHR